MSLTDDPSDPRLTHGSDTEPVEMAAAYLVLSAEELAKGFVRPVRRTYRHVGPVPEGTPSRNADGTLVPVGKGCGTVTSMGLRLAETYARDPSFYSGTYCVGCRMHRPVGATGEFVWVNPDSTDGERVGT